VWIVTRSGRSSIVLGAVLVVVGLLFAALPKEWLEERFAIEPDAGNGSVELLLVLAPIVIGGALIARGVMASRGRVRGGLRAVEPPPPSSEDGRR
jgi:hypothetical protein